MNAAALDCAVRGRSRLAEASFELANGEIERACESGWNAAELLFTAIADERGWQRDVHRHFYDIATRLDEELDDMDIHALLACAGQLRHSSDFLAADMVGYCLVKVAELVACIQSMLTEPD